MVLTQQQAGAVFSFQNENRKEVHFPVWVRTLKACTMNTPDEDTVLKAIEDAAEKQPLGSMARELLLRRARQAETAAHISDWLRSSELRPPK